MLCRNIGIMRPNRGRHQSSVYWRRSVGNLILDIEPGHNGATIDGFNHRWTDDHTIEVEVDKDAGLNRVFEQLSEQQVKVLSMRNKANRLEELLSQWLSRVVEEGAMSIQHQTLSH